MWGKSRKMDSNFRLIEIRKTILLDRGRNSRLFEENVGTWHGGECGDVGKDPYYLRRGVRQAKVKFGEGTKQDEVMLVLFLRPPSIRSLLGLFEERVYFRSPAHLPA